MLVSQKLNRYWYIAIANHVLGSMGNVADGRVKRPVLTTLAMLYGAGSLPDKSIVASLAEG